MLIASPVPVVLVIFAYYKNQAPSFLQNEQLQFFKRATQRSDFANKQNEELQEEFENEMKNLLIELEKQATSELSPEKMHKIKSIKQSIQKREGI